ncbi:MAG: VCBS repeat-containing protein [Nanoarchaeota archaeon]
MHKLFKVIRLGKIMGLKNILIGSGVCLGLVGVGSLINYPNMVKAQSIDYPPFDHPVSEFFSMQENSHIDLEIADVNRDGNPDLIVATYGKIYRPDIKFLSQYTGVISIFLNDGSGKFHNSEEKLKE